MKKKSKWTTIIIIGVICFLVLGGAFFYFYSKAKKAPGMPEIPIMPTTMEGFTNLVYLARAWIAGGMF